MKLFPLISLVAISFAAFSHISSAEEKVESDTLIVAELFTSQGCSSCPPAEKLFSKLADQDNVLTLEWHVDYWDDLVHGGSRWKDVYSSDAFTNRQRAYNQTLRGVRNVYTPQAIVNGRLEGVGSRPHEVSNMIKHASELKISVQIDANTVSVGKSNKAADILFVRLLKEHQTDVKGGENKGRKLAGKNIVLAAEVLGQTGTESAEFTLPSIGDGESCAVIVQSLDNANVGPILGAAKCG